MWFWLSALITIIIIKKSMAITAREAFLEFYPKEYRFLDSKREDGCGKTIFEFVDDHMNVLEFAKSKNLIFVIGNDRAREIELVSFLAGADLKVVETTPDSREYKIVDIDGQINEYPVCIVPELVPLLIADKRLGINYYIMPHFNVTDNVKYDLTITHLTERVMKYANRMKFLLVTTNDAIKDDVPKIMFDMCKTIVNVNKFKSKISLVVTGVQENTNKSDNSSIELGTVNELQFILYEFEKTLKNSDISNEEKEPYQCGVQILNELLTNKKVNIFPKPTEVGPMNAMKVFQDRKINILAMVLNNTQYIDSTLDDFRYGFLQNNTITRLSEVTHNLTDAILKSVSNIHLEIRKIYTNIESTNFDIEFLWKTFDDVYKHLHNIGSIQNLKKFAEKILETAKLLQIKIAPYVVSKFLNRIELMEFIAILQNTDLSGILQSITNYNSSNYISDSKRWYGFLKNLHNELSEYKVQLNVTKYARDVALLMLESKIAEKSTKNVDKIGLKRFLNKIDSNLFSQLKGMMVNSFKLNHLQAVLNRTMFDVGAISCYPDKFEFRGYNIKLSDFANVKCSNETKFKSMFALNKIFIDADIEIIGDEVQLTIIAPTIEVIGNRTIKLSGIPGMPYKHSATNGTENDIGGKNGLVGRPGRPGGSLTMIGDKYINDQQLTFISSGGLGGTGQNGGKGNNAQNLNINDYILQKHLFSN